MAEQIVIGLIELRGLWTFQLGASTDWELDFWLQPWREENGELQNKELRVKKNIRDYERQSYMNRLQRNTVIRAKVDISKSYSSYFSNFELLDDNYMLDEELNAIAIERATPKYYQHERFGTLSLNRERHLYKTKAIWAGNEIELSFQTEDETELVALLNKADAFWNEEGIWNQKIRDFIIAEFLELKNKWWSREDEEPYSAEQLLALLKHESIYISPEYSPFEFTFDYDDAFLFSGRSIWVRGNLDDGLFESGL